ncbi:hypothetical protein DNU06_17100 [Putridiphycobacter roseus]|uniref:Uncharacterized protein n=2 Tax=Putridiphycobacter roseus TaxID=2219161 RepID=A0A2W1MUZ0_9FLAO|nr:hypothetical protein DNU06_17100 [Putridiphycobacter roseus]
MFFSCVEKNNSSSLSSQVTEKQLKKFKETPERLSEIVSAIAKINELQASQIGIGGEEGENYKNFRNLKANSTIDELVQLTANKNETVATYAGWALADTNYSDLKTIFNNFILQETIVETYSGCIISEDYSYSSIYYRYYYNLNHSERAKDKILFQLDSSILSSQNSERLLQIALENRIYDESYIDRIETLAFEKQNTDALFYLCKWNKSRYATEIRSELVRLLESTDNYTSNYFYQVIDELFDYKDFETKQIIVQKLKEDRAWESKENRFIYLLNENNIYNIDHE